MPQFTIKICGLSTSGSMAAALDAGADMVGLVFHPKSPRYVAPPAAAALAGPARGRAAVVALVVDADDGLLEEIVGALRPDWIQCHGRETPARLDEIRALSGARVMKAVGIASAADLDAIAVHRGAADLILLDAKPPKDAAYPGGHGRPFDWSLLAGLPADLPFMLSGGLGPGNVAGAVRAVRAMGLAIGGVDVSSGVESAPGLKDNALIAAFVAAARAA